jgi:hypothetical protein
MVKSPAAIPAYGNLRSQISTSPSSKILVEVSAHDDELLITKQGTTSMPKLREDFWFDFDFAYLEELVLISML